MPSVPTMLKALRLGLRYSLRAEKRAGIAVLAQLRDRKKQDQTSLAKKKRCDFALASCVTEIRRGGLGKA